MKYFKYVIGGTAAAAVAAAYAIYRYGFYSPGGTQNDDHQILIPMTKEQHDQSIAMIERLNRGK